MHCYFFCRTSILMLSIMTSSFFTFAWLLRIFVLLGWISNPTASVLLLTSRNISSKLCSDVENNSTSSANRKFVRQSSFLTLSLMPFWFLPASCLTLLETLHFLCLSRQHLLGLCRAAAKIPLTKVRHHGTGARTTRPTALFGRRLS